MSWTLLGNNQMVSYLDASTSPFTLKAGQSHLTTLPAANQCMDKTAMQTKYNLLASNLTSYASNQLVPKSAWAAGDYNAILTVGSPSSGTTGYRNGVYGSITSTDISIPAGAMSVLNSLYHQGGTLAIGITNGSTTVTPNRWTTISISGIVFNRTSFAFSYNGPTGQWLYTLAVATNPFGTTIGDTRIIIMT